VPACRVQQLRWLDPDLGSIALPGGEMAIRAGFGSGLAVRPGDPPGRVWAICDRGPNLKAQTLSDRYGLELPTAVPKGAKIMPRLDLGPTLAELAIDGDEINLLRTIRLTDADGGSISGLPLRGSEHVRAEPAFDLAGQPLVPDPNGTDSEGLVALRDGGFWIGDEYGPSLIRVDSNGRLIRRWLPTGLQARGEPKLPAIAGRRQINRGFEALAISPDEQWLFLAFQSPLAHPDEAAHEQGRHVRIWRLDATGGEVTAQYLYPLDAPDSFRRDCLKGKFERADIKVSEILWMGESRLLVLERGSETTKLYCVVLDEACAIPPAHLDVETCPTVEELSGGDRLSLPVLEKQLIFSSDDAPQVAADLEGMAWLSPSQLLLVSDNDFGVEGARTSFWRLSFDQAFDIA
jgi:hypothetical protein